VLFQIEHGAYNSGNGHGGHSDNNNNGERPRCRQLLSAVSVGAPTASVAVLTAAATPDRGTAQAGMAFFSMEASVRPLKRKLPAVRLGYARGGERDCVRLGGG
jgi:hypothetical protein